jgi:hypothetical protein
MPIVRNRNCGRHGTTSASLFPPRAVRWTPARRCKPLAMQGDARAMQIAVGNRKPHRPRAALGMRALAAAHASVRAARPLVRCSAACPWLGGGAPVSGLGYRPRGMLVPRTDGAAVPAAPPPWRAACALAPPRAPGECQGDCPGRSPFVEGRPHCTAHPAALSHTVSAELLPTDGQGAARYPHGSTTTRADPQPVGHARPARPQAEPPHCVRKRGGELVAIGARQGARGWVPDPGPPRRVNHS